MIIYENFIKNEDLFNKFAGSYKISNKFIKRNKILKKKFDNIFRGFRGYQSHISFYKNFNSDFFDHTNFFPAWDGELIITTQPYSSEGCCRKSVEEFASTFKLDYAIYPSSMSFYNTNSTILIVFKTTSKTEGGIYGYYLSDINYSGSVKHINRLKKGKALYFIFKDTVKHGMLGGDIEIKIDLWQLEKIFNGVFKIYPKIQRNPDKGQNVKAINEKVTELKDFTLEEFVNKKADDLVRINNNIKTKKSSMDFALTWEHLEDDAPSTFYEYYKDITELDFDDCIKIFIDNFDVKKELGIKISEPFIGFIWEDSLGARTYWDCNRGYCRVGGDISLCNYTPQCFLKEIIEMGGNVSNQVRHPFIDEGDGFYRCKYCGCCYSEAVYDSVWCRKCGHCSDLSKSECCKCDEICLKDNKEENLMENQESCNESSVNVLDKMISSFVSHTKKVLEEDRKVGQANFDKTLSAHLEEKNELSCKLQHLECERKRLESANNDLNDINGRLINDSSDIRRSVIDKDKEILELKCKVGDLSKYKEELINQVGQLEDNNKTLIEDKENLTALLNEKMDTIGFLEAEVNNLKSNNLSLDGLDSEASECIANMEQALNELIQKEI